MRAYRTPWLLSQIILLLCTTVCVRAQDQADHSGQAQQAFAAFGPSIYQVRIINIKSHNLNSSGSGFYVGDGSLFATNYHVVSSVVLEPDDYKIIVEQGKQKLELTLAAIDVINDLALLHIPHPGQPLQLRESIPAKGEKLYSVGNPHNLGMTIVEGNYNGLATDYVFDRIHYSGALNPGMSGGPTIDARGRVVGVNVQTAGNQVGFLVPVSKLRAMLEHLTETAETEFGLGATNEDNPWHAVIARQVAAATEGLIDAIDQAPWPNEALADAVVAGKIHPAFQCWGTSDKDEKKKVLKVTKGCNSRQSLYISQALTTGYFEYEFSLLEGDDWPEGAFYKYASNEFSHGRASNQAGEEDVGNFSCVNNVIQHADSSMRRRAVFCVRPYKKLTGLFDVFYMGVSLNKSHKILMEHYCLSGVTQEKNREFMERFMRQVTWQ